MTYLPFYSIKAATTRTANETGLTLYEASKALAKAAKAGTVRDATHISRDGRCVGYWSEWHGQVRGMFGATDEERELLNEWAHK